jgi:hypothetical protein
LQSLRVPTGGRDAFRLAAISLRVGALCVT